MSWFSLLPESFSFIEKWAIRMFILLGFIAIGPWLLLIVYDIIFYCFRTATYEVPYIGGRARNRPRPRAPSLRKTTIAPESDVAADAVDGLKKRLERSNHQRGEDVIDDN